MIEKAVLIWRNPPTWEAMVAQVVADPSIERILVIWPPSPMLLKRNPSHGKDEQEKIPGA